MALKYCPNLTMSYTEHPFLDRFAKTAGAGFRAVEALFPYDYDLLEIKARLEDLGLTQVLFNLHAGDTTAGEWGTFRNPHRRTCFRWSLAMALEVASVLKCPRIHAMFGNKVAGLERDA